jgi:hypothetical protein
LIKQLAKACRVTEPTPSPAPLKLLLAKPARLSSSRQTHRQNSGLNQPTLLGWKPQAPSVGRTERRRWAADLMGSDATLEDVAVQLLKALAVPLAGAPPHPCKFQRTVSFCQAGSQRTVVPPTGLAVVWATAPKLNCHRRHGAAAQSLQPYPSTAALASTAAGCRNQLRSTALLSSSACFTQSLSSYLSIKCCPVARWRCRGLHRGRCCWLVSTARWSPA